MEYEIAEGRIELELKVLPMGEDLNVALTGGDSPHLGSVAVAFSAPGAAGGGKEFSVSLITLPGHREDLLARETALTIAEGTGRNCAVSCGIHIDGITPPEISRVLELSRYLVNKFLAEQNLLL